MISTIDRISRRATEASWSASIRIRAALVLGDTPVESTASETGLRL